MKGRESRGEEREDEGGKMEIGGLCHKNRAPGYTDLKILRVDVIHDFNHHSYNLLFLSFVFNLSCEYIYILFSWRSIDVVVILY